MVVGVGWGGDEVIATAVVLVTVSTVLIVIVISVAEEELGRYVKRRCDGSEIGMKVRRVYRHTIVRTIVLYYTYYSTGMV